jgi:hypothetical protein
MLALPKPAGSIRVGSPGHTLAPAAELLPRLTVGMPITLNGLAPWGVIEIARHHLLLTFSTAIGFAVFMTARYLRSPWRKIPPGPRGFLLLGNALQLRSQQWLTFMKWKHEFGRSCFSFCRCENLFDYYLLRRRFLLECGGSTYNSSQHPENRGRFARPPCRNLL